MALTDKPHTAVEPPNTSSMGDAVLRALVPGVFWILPLIWAAVYLLPPANFDSSLILSISQRWLDGERLYIDLVDVNPPLIFAVNLIPAVIAKFTGISAPLVLVLCILTLIAVAFWLSVKTLPAALHNGDGMVRMMLPPLILYALVIFPGEMFSQREHLMLVTLFPYTLLASARVANVPVPTGRRLAIAILAAVGFALKPHFLVIPALIELFILMRRGIKVSIRDFVPWVMAGFFVLYLIAARFLTPAYFTDVLPLVFSTYSEVGGATPMTILLGNQLGPALLLIIPLGIAAYIARLSDLTRMIVLAAVGAAAGGMLQDKGWPYHLLPALALAFVLAGLAVAAALDRLTPSAAKTGMHMSPPPAARAVAGVVLLVFIAYTINERRTFYDQYGFSDSPAGQLLKVVKPNAEGQHVLILSPGVYPHFPMLNYANAKLGLRFQTIWPLQGAYEECEASGPRYHSRDEMPEAERALDRAVIEDFDKYKPPLVIIDKIPGIKYCGGKDFDLLEYFLRQPGFAREMARYDLLTQFDRYIIFKRRADTPTAASPDQ
jgi:hypothetical protein